jgi:hypothetical protein
MVPPVRFVSATTIGHRSLAREPWLTADVTRRAARDDALIVR